MSFWKSIFGKKEEEKVDFITANTPNPVVAYINADGTYSSKSEGADFITIKILGSDELTDAQKSYLLYTKFGIKPEHVANMLNDPHYN